MGPFRNSWDALSQPDRFGDGAQMIRKSIIIASWACLIFIVYATLTSIEMRPELVPFYKRFFTTVERVGAFALLGLLFGLAYPRKIAFVCLLVFGSAVILELLQLLTPDRHARALDASVKMAGGAAGILAAGAALALIKSRRNCCRTTGGPTAGKAS